MARTDDRFRNAYNRLLDICSSMRVGDQLPPETALAEQMEVSRTIVRNALQRLDDEKIVCWEGRSKTLIQMPADRHRLASPDTHISNEELEQRFLEWILKFDVPAGTSLNVALLSPPVEPGTNLASTGVKLPDWLTAWVVLGMHTPRSRLPKL